MELRDKLNLALTRYDYPPLAASATYRQVGSGTWHDAYLVQPPGTEPLASPE